LHLLVAEGEGVVVNRWFGAVVGMSLASSVAAQNTFCSTELEDEDIRGNLNVAVPCTVTGTEIRGNVTIFAGGSLIGRDARIRGNLDARRADFVDLSGSRIEGNVRLEELVGDRSTLDDTDIDGNVTLSDNRSLLEVFDSEIDGNVRVSGNSGGVVISGNVIDGNLECSRNAPAPIGGGNRVEKRASGQCANLQRISVPEPAAPPSSPPVVPAAPPTSPPRATPPPSPPVAPSAPPASPPPAAPASPPTIVPAGGSPPPPSAPAPAPAAPPNELVPRPDITPPTLTLRGSATVNILIDSIYTDEGASAMDDIDGDLTPLVVAVSNVDTKKLGVYTVTYSVSDRAGNSAQSLSRTVNVTPVSTAQEGPGGGGAILIELLVLVVVAWQRAVRSERRKLTGMSTALTAPSRFVSSRSSQAVASSSV
jgi:hypothetical protein